MIHKICTVTLSLLLLIGILSATGQFQSAKAATITVPDDYPTTQEAINHAMEGDTVFVRNGTYCENVIVNKTVSLIGENSIPGTTINGSYAYQKSVVSITVDDVLISGFTIQNGWCGVAVHSSDGCIIAENRIVNNSYRGGGGEIYESGRGVWLIDSENCTVVKNVMKSNDRNVSFKGAHNNTIMNNTITNSLISFGIILENSHSNSISSNAVKYSVSDGLHLAEANNNEIVANVMMGNGGEGIYVSGSGNTIARNIVQNNSGEGIWLDWSNNNTVIGNTLTSNEKRGILIWHSIQSVTCHNNFVNNSWDQAYSNLINTWDYGYPSGGNYWSDYTGVDLYHGVYQNMTGSDNIGDTPYLIDENNADRYPLMFPYGTEPTYDWPMFRHDSNHTGYSTSTAPHTNHTLWTYTTGGEVPSSPAVADGKVYIGSGDGKLYCLNALTGAQVWNNTIGDFVIDSPAVADGEVYVGSVNGKVYCFDASTGVHIWNYTTGGEVESSPAVADGKVYVGSWDHKVYCLNATTGTQIWNYTTGIHVTSSPAVSDGRVYVGSFDSKVYCLDALTGVHIWNYTTGDAVESSPAVADGKIYVGSDDGKIYCLNATTGTQIWNNTAYTWISSPAVIDGKVFVGSSSPYNKVYCLNATTGAYVWNCTIGDLDFVGSSPAVADGKVYVGSYFNEFYCLNATTGEQVWSYNTGGATLSSPAIAYGRVYVGSYDRKIYAFGEIHGVAITDLVTSKSDCLPLPTVGQGRTLTVNASVENLGEYAETFNVSFYAGSFQVEQREVSLDEGENAALSFIWDTTAYTYGNYTLRIEADIVPYEAYWEDNTDSTWIILTIQGDIDGNYNVQLADLVLLAKTYGSKLGDSNWNPNADIDSNGIVGLTDLVILATNYGRHYP